MINHNLNGSRLIYLLLLFFTFLLSINTFIPCETQASDWTTQLFSINFKKNAHVYVSPSGSYILVVTPAEAASKDTELDPGGIYKLYNKKGILLWEKRYSEDLFFCSNENYLMQPTAIEFTSLEQPSIYYLKNGNLFYRLTDNGPEVYSFDVNQGGGRVLVGLFDGNILLFDKTKKLWTYSTDDNAPVDVAFSKDGAFFMENLSGTLFRMDKNGAIAKIDILKLKMYPQSPAQIRMSGSVDFIFNLSNQFFKYIPKKNKLYQIDVSNIIDVQKKAIQRNLGKKYNIKLEQIMFSKYLDHFGIISDNTFHYFKIN